MAEKKAIHKFKAGDVFDERYILEKLMGSGGFADVWKAKDKDTNSSIALKIYTNLDDDGINDLASEYTRMQNLNHTNILKADYFARWGNIPYLVMKVCEGGSLSKKVGCIDDTELMHVIQDIAEGLTYLHQNKIVHQDIIGDCHAALRRIRIIKEPVASKFKGIVVVFLNQVKYFRVDRHHTVSPSLCFHTTDNIAFVKMHVL